MLIKWNAGMSVCKRELINRDDALILVVAAKRSEPNLAGIFQGRSSAGETPLCVGALYTFSLLLSAPIKR